VRLIVRQLGANELEILRVRSVRMENLNLNRTLNLFSRARAASNEELFAGVETLTMTEHGLLVKVVVLLGEIDRRGSYREKAWPSLFEYCVSHLKYSEGQACRRIYAARALHKFPALLPLFEKRAITLTNLAKVSRALTDENHMALARDVGTNSKDVVERILAKWFPQPDLKPMIRQLPTTAPLPSFRPPPPATATSASPPPLAPPPAMAMATPQPGAGKVKPLSEKRYAVQSMRPPSIVWSM
jgi:hypothetical protein